MDATDRRGRWSRRKAAESVRAGGATPAADDGLPDQIAGLVGDVTQRDEDGHPGPDLNGAGRARGGRARVARALGRYGPIGAVARQARRATQVTRRGIRTASHWLVAEILAMAPRIPVRDQATLRAHFPGRSPEETAEALIEGAARASAGVGGTVGAWSVLPVAPAFPAQLATETMALVGIEIKLVAELHEVYGMRAPGDLVSRMTAYVGAWTRRRGASLAPGDMVLALGSPLRRRLHQRVEVRAAKSAVSLGPLFTGAAAGAVLNYRETRRLGSDIRDDLRRRSPLTGQWPD